MSRPAYFKKNLVLKKGPNRGKKSLVRELQRDLRRLGYLARGIDGRFGNGTARAVKALQHDLLHNHGTSTRNNGPAPIAVADYNKGRVVAVTGELDYGLAGCLKDLLEEDKFPKLPRAENPREENRKIRQLMSSLTSKTVPVPFVLAILRQESGLRHFNEPREGDDDTYVTLGLDTNAAEKYIVTSRGYGAGQYTLFHHPPSGEEMAGFILDWRKNLDRAIRELRDKFDHFVNGPTRGTQADDRLAEQGDGPLNPCKYEPEDIRYLRDCRHCALEAGTREIEEGKTRLYPGSAHVYTRTRYYRTANYSKVPVRKRFECDWPYAARRYNGSGINSYHYQARILKNLLKI